MRPFAIYPAAFDGSTLGSWRFGERGGRLVDIVNAKVLANTGADPLDEGYRFIAGNADHMLATFASEPARLKWTAEGWVRNYGVLDYTTTYVFSYYETATWSPRILLSVTGRLPGVGSSIINAVFRAPSGVIADIQWSATAFSTLLVAPEPWHFAVVLDADAGTFSLFINGVLRAIASAGIVALAANTYLLRLGRQMSAANYLSGILDEVRFSAAARYAGSVLGTRYFTPARFGEGRRAAARGPGLECLAGVMP